MKSPAIDRSLVSDQVFQVLCEAILSGSYRPGEKLPTQRRLAADFGVNMAPVREAIKRLEQLRLLEVRQGDAMRVRDWHSHAGLDMVGHVIFGAAGLHRPTLSAVMEARRAMLAEVASLAASRRRDAQSQRLVELAHQIARAASAEAAQALDFAFFSEMVEAAGNVVYTLIMNTLRDLYFARAELFLAVVEDRAELAPLYSAAALAIAANDGPLAASRVAELAALQTVSLQKALG
ncbi:MAG: FadR/GntR family transcriptional regulator [Solirubrobacterales bacterium]